MILTLADINNFGPAHSEVWGTVSDFGAFLLSIFTVILVYRTFKSQRKVEKGQQLVSRITFYDFIKKIKPVLDIAKINIGARFGENKFRFEVRNNGDHNAFNIHYQINQQMSDKTVTIESKRFLCKMLTDENGTIDFDYHPVDGKPTLNIILWYEDEAHAGKYIAEWSTSDMVDEGPISDGLVDRSLFEWKETSTFK